MSSASEAVCLFFVFVFFYKVFESGPFFFALFSVIIFATLFVVDSFLHLVQSQNDCSALYGGLDAVGTALLDGMSLTIKTKPK